MLGKWKATVQFAAIALAMLRPDVTIAGAYLDEWGMVARRARHRLVGRRLPAEVLRRAALRRREPRLRHGRQRGDRRRARRAPGRARRRGRRARALGRGRGARCGRAAPRWCAATSLDEDALARGMDGASWPSTSPASTRCASRIPSRCGASTSTARWPRSGPPRARACRGSSTRPRPRPSASRPAPSAARTRRTAAGTCRPTSARRPRASARCSPRPRETGQDVVLVNPSSVQGPGRAGGTGRFLLAFLDGRLKVFVQTNVSLVDIADCVEGHLLAAERGQARRALPAQRDDADDHRGARARRRRRRRAAQRRGCCRGRVATVAARASSSAASASRAAVRRCAARWSARCCTATATTARAPSASSACATPIRARRSRRTVEWARRRGPAEERLRRASLAVEDVGEPVEHLLLALGDELGRKPRKPPSLAALAGVLGRGLQQLAKLVGLLGRRLLDQQPVDGAQLVEDRPRPRPCPWA